MRSVEMALGFARGIPGVMRPNHLAADSDDAISLLRYGFMIQQAEEPKPQYRPKWLWNLAGKIALRYWKWKYKGLPEARVREWLESRQDSEGREPSHRRAPKPSSEPKGGTAHKRTSLLSLAAHFPSKTNGRKI
jgi:hypothetical protein